MLDEQELDPALEERARTLAGSIPCDCNRYAQLTPRRLACVCGHGPSWHNLERCTWILVPGPQRKEA